MKRSLVMALSFAACWSGSQPVEQTAGSAEPKKKMTETPARPSAPQRLELVEGTPVTLPDGVVVDVKHVGYAHLSNSGNLSNATLVVTRDTLVLEIGVVREHGGSNPSKTTPFADAFGWRFTLEMADPYQQPSRAIVEATRISP